jgi:hypothetical protein
MTDPIDRIDPAKPPPGKTVAPGYNPTSNAYDAWYVWAGAHRYDGAHSTESEARAEAHRIYAEESRPAVVDFAERVAAWMMTKHDEDRTLAEEEARLAWLTGADETASECAWIAEQILAAARGERTLP